MMFESTNLPGISALRSFRLVIISLLLHQASYIEITNDVTMNCTLYNAISAPCIQISKKLANSKFADKHNGKNDGSFRKSRFCPHHNYIYFCCDGYAAICQELLWYVMFFSNLNYH